MAPDVQMGLEIKINANCVISSSLESMEILVQSDQRGQSHLAASEKGFNPFRPHAGSNWLCQSPSRDLFYQTRSCILARL